MKYTKDLYPSTPPGAPTDDYGLDYTTEKDDTACLYSIYTRPLTSSPDTPWEVSAYGEYVHIPYPTAHLAAQTLYEAGACEVMIVPDKD